MEEEDSLLLMLMRERASEPARERETSFSVTKHNSSHRCHHGVRCFYLTLFSFYIAT